jgi:hypothetical protein
MNDKTYDLSIEFNNQLDKYEVTAASEAQKALHYI